MKNFENKIVLITGAGSGIGRETAYAFSERGAQIIVADINEQGAKETVDTITQQGGKATFHYCDVAKRESVSELADAVHELHDHVDVLINNAGIGVAGTFLNTTLDTWDKVIDINLKGVIYGCHFFLPKMVESKQPCHVVNLASAAAFVAPQEMPIYGTSKSAVLGFSEILRMDMANHNIGVTAICPGLINTPIVANTKVETDTNDGDKFINNAVKMYERRNYPPSKVAKAIVKAVESNSNVKPVSPEAWFMYYGKRLMPGLWQQLGKMNLVKI